LTLDHLREAHTFAS